MVLQSREQPHDRGDAARALFAVSPDDLDLARLERLGWAKTCIAQIQRADRWFQRHGQQIVLYGRVIPVIRAFVSLPAGIAKMPVGRFTVLTVIGSVPWVLGFALAGHALGGDWKSVRNGLEYVDYVLLAAIVLGLVYWRVHRKKAREARAEAALAEPTEPARVGTPAD